ncbi:MAG: hypothetical protein IIB22_10315, partial [Chloroflexi bacterium]|nr:hypothetical protein [Chloroflexota bacterium]
MKNNKTAYDIGIVLVEVIVAVSIISFSLVGIIGAFNFYIKASIDNTDKIRETYLQFYLHSAEMKYLDCLDCDIREIERTISKLKSERQALEDIIKLKLNPRVDIFKIKMYDNRIDYINRYLISLEEQLNEDCK